MAIDRSLDALDASNLTLIQVDAKPRAEARRFPLRGFRTNVVATRKISMMQ